jgi:hypothetical protein
MNSSTDARSLMLEDELQLMHLGCVRLTNALQGTLSIGSTLLATKISDPEAFLTEQFQFMDSLALVLSKASGKGGSGKFIAELREYAARLREALTQLHTTFRHLRPNDLEGLEERLTALHELVARICGEITSYQKQLGFDAPEAERVMEVIRSMVECVVREARQGRSALAPAVP